jgi:hypothetical protein
MAEPLDPGLNGADHAPPPSADNGAYQVPEKFRGKSVEEIARAYDELERMHGTRMQELEPLVQYQQKYAQYGGIEALEQGYNQLYTNLQHYLQNAQQSQPQQQAGQPVSTQQNPWENWEYLTPQEQAARLEERIAQRAEQLIAERGQALYNQAYQDLSNQFNVLRREWDINRSLTDMRYSDPNLDTQKVMQEAVNIANSDPQKLLQLAARQLANQDGKQTEAQAQALFERYKADWEQERTNRQLEQLGRSGGQTLQSMFPSTEERPPDSSAIHAEVARKLIGSDGLTLEHFTG